MATLLSMPVEAAPIFEAAASEEAEIPGSSETLSPPETILSFQLRDGMSPALEVHLLPVPEPATIGLVGFALVLGAVLMKRRKVLKAQSTRMET